MLAVLALLILALGTVAWVQAPAQGDGQERPTSAGLAASDTQTFADVPPTHPYYAEIEWLYQNGYTAGCNTNPLMYCPEATMNRAELAVFMERGIHSASYEPTLPSGQIFADVALDSWAAKWVNGLWEDQYTAGCGTNPLMYCPWQGHTRAEGAVFYLRMLHGANYEPVQPTQQMFADVPLDVWYAKWAQAAYEAGLITSCQGSPEMKFCPEGPLSRGLAAYMMVRAKSGPGRIFYVSPSGSDSNPGTLGQPWRTLQKAVSAVAAGDTIYMRGGIYYETAEIWLGSGSNGSEGKRIRLWNYPGETPIFDFGKAPDGTYGIIFENKNFWHLRGMEVRNNHQKTTGDWFVGFEASEVNNTIFENLNVHHFGDMGFGLYGNSTGNLILNSDFHHNYDPYTRHSDGSPNAGDNADGLGLTTDDGTSNTIRGCRFWLNSDDGLDLWDAEGKVIAENNWSFWNGYYVPEGQPDDNRIHPEHGNGNGFKLGRTLASSNDPTYRVVLRNLAFENWLNGIDQNGSLKAMTIYNNTAYKNAAAASWGGGFLINDYVLPHIIRNNIAYGNRDDRLPDVPSGVIQDHNSWNLTFRIVDGDFLSLDSSGMDGPRQPDGSLPDLPFLKLKEGSKLIDAGIDVGLPYYGSLPDIGAYEFDDAVSSSGLAP